MKFFSQENYKKILSLYEQANSLVSDKLGGFAFQYERQAAHEIHIARKITEWINPYDECILWIREYGIWPSHENWFLYERLRSSYGDTAKIAEAPLHVFYSTESNDLTTFLELALRFGWGGDIIYKPKIKPTPLYLRFNHHGWFFVDGKLQELIPLSEDIEKLGIAILWKSL
jgi:hypothetical protein